MDDIFYYVISIVGIFVSSICFYIVEIEEAWENFKKLWRGK
jgi:hypothetical protein